MKTLSLAIAALLSASTSAASAETVERRFDQPPFHAIDLFGSDTLIVKPGATIAVTATGEADAIAALDIGVKGDRLRISRKPRTHTRHGVTIVVTMPAIHALEASGSGDVTVSGFHEPKLVTDMAGSGSLTLRDMTVGEGRFELSGSGGVRLDHITARALALFLNGSGSLTAAGTAGNLAIEVNGSGSADTRALVADDATLSVSGSGDLKAQARRTATVSAAGSGSVAVTGHPRCTVAGRGGQIDCG